MSLKLVKHAAEFAEILRIIRGGRAKAFEAVNVALIDTYWAVGAYLSRKVSEAGWGKGIVQELATLAAQVPDLKGFSSSNLWRMKQFYEVYQNDEKLAPLVRQSVVATRACSTWHVRQDVDRTRAPQAVCFAQG